MFRKGGMVALFAVRRKPNLNALTSPDTTVQMHSLTCTLQVFIKSTTGISDASGPGLESPQGANTPWKESSASMKTFNGLLPGCKGSHYSLSGYPYVKTTTKKNPTKN